MKYSVNKLSVIVENPDGGNLAFVMHGLGGFKEQDHIKTFADSFIKDNFTVVRFDTRNTFGESEGNYENANITNYYEDLEEVITWAKTQEWYKEPFFLAGHSLGGICILLYALKHPKEVRALAPIATVVAGKLTAANEPKERVDEWNRTGWKISPSGSKPGVMKKLNWTQFIADTSKYDILPDAHKLTMPVLLIAGDKDNGTPVKDQQLLFDKLSGERELHVIKDGPHTFREKKQLEEVEYIFRAWISKVFKL